MTTIRATGGPRITHIRSPHQKMSADTFSYLCGSALRWDSGILPVHVGEWSVHGEVCETCRRVYSDNQSSLDAEFDADVMANLEEACKMEANTNDIDAMRTGYIRRFYIVNSNFCLLPGAEPTNDIVSHKKSDLTHVSVPGRWDHEGVRYYLCGVGSVWDGGIAPRSIKVWVDHGNNVCEECIAFYEENKAEIEAVTDKDHDEWLVEMEEWSKSDNPGRANVGRLIARDLRNDKERRKNGDLLRD